MQKSPQEVYYNNLHSLAEQIRLDRPGAKLSEVQDWAVANGIDLRPALDVPEFNRFLGRYINGSNGSKLS